MNNKIKKSKGFTLTELIVVIVIIGILAAVLIPTLTGYIKKANQSADEQEVAMLNKMTMLWDYEDNKPASVKELKEMLEEEGYTGDYTLRVKGNYLWYDVKENRFTILAEEKLVDLDSGELTNLATNPETYKLTTNMKSPEGLLNNDGVEVWLVGGNGKLVDTIDDLRNLADNEIVSDPKKAIESAYALSTELGLQETIKNFVNSVKFYCGSTELAYTINDDGTVNEASETEKQERENYIVADIYEVPAYSELASAFHNKFLYDVKLQNMTNIELINSTLIDATTKEPFAKFECDDKLNIDGSYNIIISIYDKTKTPFDAVTAFDTLMLMLQYYNVESGKVLPIFDGKIVSETTFNSFINVDLDCNVDLTGETPTGDFAALLMNALYYAEETVEVPDPTKITFDALLDKNTVYVIADVNSPVDGSFQVKYNFTFKGTLE